MEFTSEGAVSSAPIVPNARDEFGTLKTAIVHAFSSPQTFAAAHHCSVEQASDLMADDAAPPDLHAHLRLTQLLRDRGVRLIHPHAPNIPLTAATMKKWMGTDIYCRDFLGVVDQHVILSNVISFRNHSRAHYQSILKNIPQDRQSTTEDTFTWGNALLLDDKILVGLEHNDYFTDIAPNVSVSRLQEEFYLHQQKSSGIRGMKSLLSNIGSTRTMLTVPMNANSDLDCALAPLPRRRATGPRVAFIQTQEIHSEAVGVLESQFDTLIPVEDPYKARGCNIVWLDPETPLVSEEAIRTRLALRKLGFDVIDLPLGTFMEIDNTGTEHEGSAGGWRCMTGVLERANDYPFH